jgi:transcriptional regulator with XRE-family HTH domain
MHQDKWLADKLGKGEATVSKWTTNTSQPTLANLIDIAKALNVKVGDLIRQ